MANFHKHWYGTLALYTAIATKDSNTLYHCSEGLIYKGSVLLATRRWGDLSGKPSTFAPSAHTHAISNVTGLQTALNSKLETSTFNTHNNDDVIHITGAERTKWDGVVSDFAGLKIGGRNLLQKSRLNYIPSRTSGTGEISEIVDDELYGSVYHTNKQYIFGDELCVAGGELQVGDVITLSLLIKSKDGTQFTAQLHNTATVSGMFTIMTGIEWQWVSATRTVTGDPSIKSRLYIYASAGEYWIKQVKIEKGNKATDWTPAPEDVDASIATVQTNLDTHAALANNPHSVTKSQVGLGNVENTKLSTWAGSGSITALGTVVSGTWNASTIAVTKGGTGKTSVGKDKMLYASAANTYAEVTTTAFGRGLLNAVSGTVVSGLNADTLDGRDYDGYILSNKLSAATQPVTYNFNDFAGNAITWLDHDRSQDGANVTYENAPWTTDPAGGWSSILFKHSSYGTQLVFKYASGDIDVRYKAYSGGGANWQEWGKLYSSHNCNNTSTDWSAKNLALAGSITGATTISATKVITGGYNLTTQTAGLGIGADGTTTGIVFYNGAGTSVRIYRDGDVLYFNRGGNTSKGFYMSNNGAVTFNQAIETKGLLTATGNIATANINGAYIKVGSATISWDSANGALRIDKPVYSTSSLSAFGLGPGGTSGGSGYTRLDEWDDYTGTNSEWVLSAGLGNDLNVRVTNLETSTPNISWGTPASYYVPLNINGSTKNLSLNGHIHSQYLTGITSSQVTNALGFTPYNSTNPSGYTTNKGTVTSVGLSVPTGLSVTGSPVTVSGTLAIKLASGYAIPTTAKQGQWDTAYSNRHTHSNKSVLDGITSGLVTNWGSAYTFTSGFATSYPDLTAIEGLTGTAGFLKKTGANTWSLDTSTYLTGITKAQVEGVLTGAITTHTHDGRYYTESEIKNILSGTTVVSGYSKSNWDTAYSHTSLTNNPHGVTKSQVGLGNVLNVASYSKTQSDTNLTSAIDGIEIGGRNYFNISNVSSHTPYNTTPTVLNTNTFQTIWVSGSILTIRGTAFLSSDWAAGQFRTTSGFIKINGAIPATNPFTSNLANGYDTNAQPRSYDPTTGYFTFTEKIPTAFSTWVLHTTLSISAGDIIEIKNLKLEKGNKATDWTPAPEDVEASIATVQTNLNTHAALTNNPHGVTKAQVGLGSVNNTADSAKNVLSATKLTTTRKINGVDFNGTASITITANTPYTLTRGGYLTGSNFNGSANTTWAVDATSANTAGKVVARDSNGDFACRVVNAVSGIYSLKVVTGGHNYASQTYGVGIGTDGSNSGVIFYNGTGATGRIFRESNVLRFIRGGLSYSGFDINADGSITVQGDMTTRTSLVVGSGNGTYVQIGSARLVYDQTNNAIKVVNADNSSCSLYATGSISAFGIGSSGGGGTSYSRLDDWGDYVDGLTNDYVLSAELGHGLYTSVNSLNSFRSGTSWGNSGTGIAYLSIGGTGKVVSIQGHSHAFSAITSKPTTLGGYGITDAMSSSGGTFYGSNFQILEIKRNGSVGASMMFSNNQQVLAKFGFDASGSLVMGTGTSTDGVPDMLYINKGTKQITGYGNLVVSGNIETGTSGSPHIRIGHSRFLYDSADSGIVLLKMAGGFANFYAGSVYANQVQLTSIRSMKKDIQPFKNGLDLIKSIDVVSYLYKQDADDDDRKIGFIADDTDSWLSGKSKTKYNIGNTVGALIKAVQELEKKNHELEMRLLSVTNNKLRI